MAGATHARVTVRTTYASGTPDSAHVSSWQPVDMLPYAVAGILTDQGAGWETVITGIEFGSADGYLISSCPVHGTKECADENSQAHYRNWIQEFIAVGDYGTVYDDGTESPACCTLVRVALPGERTFKADRS